MTDARPVRPADGDGDDPVRLARALVAGGAVSLALWLAIIAGACRLV